MGSKSTRFASASPSIRDTYAKTERRRDLIEKETWGLLGYAADIRPAIISDNVVPLNTENPPRACGPVHQFAGAHRLRWPSVYSGYTKYDT